MSDINLNDYRINGLCMYVKHKCTCGERYMHVCFGSVIYDNDINSAKSLIRFVNNCNCLK